MLFSLAILFLTGLLLGAAAERAHLPRIIGLLAAGLLLGPCALDLLDASLLGISADLRKMALVVILIRAGLSLDPADLKAVGRPAVLMCFVPACFEIAGYVLLAPRLLGLSAAEAAVMGAVLAAVSPAVVVPRMLRLMEDGWGAGARIPQLIMAGASCDDVFVIVLFSSFTGLAQGGGFRAASLLRIPASIVLGIALGAAVGFALAAFFEKSRVDGVKKLLIVLSAAFLLTAAESAAGGRVPVSGLLAVMAMGCVLGRKGAPEENQALSARFGAVWSAAEILLFVLVGAAVDIRYMLSAGPAAAALIALCLLFRALGVVCCVAGTKLTRHERLFCVIAYLPKATVQAAIGAVPLAMGLG